jgi:hypothetical protein
MDTWLAWVLLLGLGFTYLHAQAGHLTAQVKAAHAKHVDAELDPAIAALRRLRNQADGDTHVSFHPDVPQEQRTQLLDAHRDMKARAARVNATICATATRSFDRNGRHGCQVPSLFGFA